MRNVRIDTVSGMSTCVDELQTNGSLRVEAVRKTSTGVDIILNTFLSYVKTVSGMSTKVDSFKLIQYRYVEIVMKTSTNSR